VNPLSSVTTSAAVVTVTRREPTAAVLENGQLSRQVCGAVDVSAVTESRTEIHLCRSLNKVGELPGD